MQNADETGILYGGKCMNKENKDNIPEDCRHCANDKDCYTYYGSNVCQNHWLKREISDDNK